MMIRGAVMSISNHNFNQAASKPTKKRDAPFSLRLSFKEKAALKRMAGDAPLGAYIKAVLFSGGSHAVKPEQAKVSDRKALGRVLGELGKSRLSQNVNQLAKAVNTGTLPVTPETEKDLQEACAALKEMRQELLRALGSGDKP